MINIINKESVTKYDVMIIFRINNKYLFSRKIHSRSSYACIVMTFSESKLNLSYVTTQNMSNEDREYQAKQYYKCINSERFSPKNMRSHQQFWFSTPYVRLLNSCNIRIEIFLDKPAIIIKQYLATRT